MIVNGPPPKFYDDPDILGWLDRTVKPRAGRYLSHGIVGVPEPPRELNLAAIGAGVVGV